MRLTAFIILLAASNALVSSLNPSRKNGLLQPTTQHSGDRLGKLSMSAAAITSSQKKGGDATISSSTFNLAKSIIGAGVLSLPSGVAFFSDKPTAMIPAAIICTVMGLVSAYTFSLIGSACEQHQADSFQDAWAKSVNPKTAWVISGSITAMCFLAALAYSIMIGDTFTALASTFQLPGQLAQRNNIILFMATFVLYPLVSLKSLNALSPFSLLGLGGTLYTAIFMAIRFFDKSYAQGGKYFSQMADAMKPSFNVKTGGSVSLIFVLVSMLSTSYIAHYNAPQFYNELKNNTMPRFNTVVGLAFAASIFLYLFMTSVGFLTFGGNAAGFVLNNYASADVLATGARLAVGLALLTGFPFTFAALRDGILDLSKITGENRAKVTPKLTIGLMGLVTALALLMKEVGFVVSLSGAMFGSALLFIVPAIMNICNMKTKATASGNALTRNGKIEIGLNYGLIVTGVFMGVLGIAISVMKQLGML